MFVDIPAAIRPSLGINGNYHTLASEFLCSLMDQLRAVDGCGIYRDLICTFTEKFPEIIHSTDSSTYGKGDKYIGSNSSYHIYHRITLFTGSRDIKKNKLVRTGCVISFGNFHRISGIFQINKIHAFYYTSFIYVQTWDNSFCKHDYASSFPVPASSAAKFSRIFKPHRLLFSGWNWHANTFPFSTDA